MCSVLSAPEAMEAFARKEGWISQMGFGSISSTAPFKMGKKRGTPWMISFRRRRWTGPGLRQFFRTCCHDCLPWGRLELVPGCPEAQPHHACVGREALEQPALGGRSGQGQLAATD